MRCRLGPILVLAALSACASPATHWTKANVTEDAAADDYETCRSAARDATSRDAQIDADITTTHSYDWQHTGTTELNQSKMAGDRRDHAQEIIARCMRGKGYKPVG